MQMPRKLTSQPFSASLWNFRKTLKFLEYFNIFQWVNIQRWRRRISSATSTPGPRDGTGVCASVSSLALELGRQNFDGFGFGDFGKTVFKDVWRFLVSFGSTNVLWCVLSRHSTKRFKTWDPRTAEVELMALQKLHADMQEEKAARNCRVIQSWVTGSYSSQYSTWLSSLVALSDDSLSGLLDFHTCQICITRKCLSLYVLSCSFRQLSIEHSELSCEISLRCTHCLDRIDLWSPLKAHNHSLQQKLESSDMTLAKTQQESLGIRYFQIECDFNMFQSWC